MCWRGFKGRQLRKMMDLEMLLCFPACLSWVAPEYMCVCMCAAFYKVTIYPFSIRHIQNLYRDLSKEAKKFQMEIKVQLLLGIIRESFCDNSQSQIRSKVMHSFGKSIVAVHTLVPDLLVLQLLCACVCVCACACAQGCAHVFSLLLCVCV